MPAKKVAPAKKQARSGKATAAKAEVQQTFADQKAWQKWLHQNHSTSTGIWLQLARVASGIPSVKHAEALEIALCYGWIDGLVRPLNEKFTLRRFVPRQKNSMWSQVNRAKVLLLIEQGRMQPAGFAAIERAKANGRWDTAYQPTSDKTIPPDLEKALKKNPKAAAAFKSLDRRNRYLITFRLQTARKPETRAARLAKFVEMLERGQKLI